MKLARREFVGVVAGAACAWGKGTGVRLGVGTYSFHGMKSDGMIRILSELKLGGVELEAAFVEPEGMGREDLRAWRVGKGIGEARAFRKRLDRGGIPAYAYNLGVNESFTDEEIDSLFGMTRALGAAIFNTPTNLTTAKRLARFAEKHRMRVGLHPSGNARDPESIGSGESYVKALEFSKYLGANPDLYLYRNWGPDPVAFLRKIHKRVTAVHLHDRKGTTWMPFGDGDLPVRELLVAAKREGWDFPFSVERIYTFTGMDPATEMRKSMDYCRKVAAAA